MKPAQTAKTAGGLFSSTDSDAEDDLFGEPKATKATSPETKKKVGAQFYTAISPEENRVKEFHVQLLEIN